MDYSIYDFKAAITICQYGNFTAEAGALVNIINGEIKKQINKSLTHGENDWHDTATR